MSSDKKFVIKSPLGAVRSELSTAQKKSSLFSEAPVIFGKILRRGTEIVVSEAQYLANKSKVDALINAGSIVMSIKGEDGQVKVDFSTDFKQPPKVPDLKVSIDGPPDGPAAPGLVEKLTTMVEEAVSDVVAAATPVVEEAVKEVAKEVVEKVESATVAPTSTPSDKKSKKGK